MNMMSTIRETKTEQNLLVSFARESMARNLYDYYGKIAKKEGFEQISMVFFKTAEQKKSLAKQFYKHFEGSEVSVRSEFNSGRAGSTLDILEYAIISEREEWSVKYPEYIQIAEEEGFQQISIIFQMVSRAIKAHEERFRRLLISLHEDRVFRSDEVVKWECLHCGYIHEGKSPPEICPACDHPKAYFEVNQI